MEKLLLEEMEKVFNSINSLVLKAFVLMTMSNVFILLIMIIIVLFNGNLVLRLVKLLQVEMAKEIDWIN
jgi:hypothetical protein